MILDSDGALSTAGDYFYNGYLFFWIVYNELLLLTLLRWFILPLLLRVTIYFILL